jgi:uncharacterized membrane protein YfcA
MGVAALAVTFAVGLLAGLLSGLVGIGGGVLMVPFLYFFYAHPALSGVRPPPDTATLAAHATSLFIIFPTSVRGAWSFHRKGMVVWRAAWPIGLAAAVTAALAAQFAGLLDPRWLRLGFAALLIFSAWRLVGSSRAPAAGGGPAPERPLRLAPGVTAGTGAVMGAFSALMGVGGGVVGIPLLINWVRVDLPRVAATSLAVITVTSLAGAGAYMAAGPAAPLRPGWSVGYVDVPVALAMSAGALAAVGWGASINRRMDKRTLSRTFAGFFLVVGALVAWQNLPL